MWSEKNYAVALKTDFFILIVFSLQFLRRLWVMSCMMHRFLKDFLKIICTDDFWLMFILRNLHFTLLHYQHHLLCLIFFWKLMLLNDEKRNEEEFIRWDHLSLVSFLENTFKNIKLRTIIHFWRIHSYF